MLRQALDWAADEIARKARFHEIRNFIDILLIYK